MLSNALSVIIGVIDLIRRTPLTVARSIVIYGDYLMSLFWMKTASAVNVKRPCVNTTRLGHYPR